MQRKQKRKPIAISELEDGDIYISLKIRINKMYSEFLEKRILLDRNVYRNIKVFI